MSPQTVVMRIRAALIIGSLALVRVCVVANRNVEREYAAYRVLEHKGATNDDWIGLTELVTGRPPVISPDIPCVLQGLAMCVQ